VFPLLIIDLGQLLSNGRKQTCMSHNVSETLLCLRPQEKAYFELLLPFIQILQISERGIATLFCYLHRIVLPYHLTHVLNVNGRGITSLFSYLPPSCRLHSSMGCLATEWKCTWTAFYIKIHVWYSSKQSLTVGITGFLDFVRRPVF
jgi:hypothetical protein